MANELKKRVLEAYKQPGHPVAFSAPGTVARYFNISPAKAKEFLEESFSYNLHREYKQPKVYNPYYVHKRRNQVQADLMDVSQVANENDGIRFLLLLIDIFTKKVWVYPILNKGTRAMVEAMQKWLDELQVKPDILMTDRGNEFINRPVQQLLRENNIEWQAAYGTMKACIAERANKTIRILIAKYQTDTESLRYIDALNELVETYNTRGHRTLENMTPNEADDPENEGRVQQIFHARYEKLGRKRREPKFRIGQLVRLKTLPKKISSSAHSYAEQFHGEYFRIVRINRTLPIPLYYLRSLDTEEHISGGFYANELQPQRGDVYIIEKVLKRRTRRGRREILVKWMFFGPRWNEWIPEANVTRAY